MKFTLEIELGNEAMQTFEDIRTALRQQVTNQPQSGIPEPGDRRNLYDRNGNTVGKWEVTQ